MRILITGSSGRVGAAIAARLVEWHEVIGIDVVPGQWTCHLADVTDRTLMFQLAREVDAIVHTASLHHPHLATHSEQDFIATNVTGTLNLLEAATQAGVRRFVYTSTTSLYGHAMHSRRKAVWVTEDLKPRQRDIYDYTKILAENLCRRFAMTNKLSAICLRIARCFPQEPHLLALYRLYRGVDVRDVAVAHELALTNRDMQFGIFNIAAQSPFRESDAPLLLHDAPAVLRERMPEALSIFARHNWPLPQSIDRVYVIEAAQRHLGYQPVYNFKAYIQELEEAQASC
ncbi:MAG: NAD(P)-dependent oxidoreductase [Ktedonobacteraceae bacterium]|nr:NAD(P)-dependent oxidoreductase [Ktedonobacteraceae bacterium]MBO0793170.1 NAD(P)-dependent oxidoreductase [Ktedonobacteraceae bacterium]